MSELHNNLKVMTDERFGAVNRAFSKQSEKYDNEDIANPILTDWRKRVYRHVNKYIVSYSKILELNAGTGIDAMYFVSQGHRVHATDISDGMINRIRYKVDLNMLDGLLSCQQCSFDQLDKVEYRGGFNYIFSNFGGLNCVEDLLLVTRHFPKLLKKGGYVTLVIMPPVCPWEWSQVVKGKWKQAFRRFNRNGTLAHLEGEFFKTYYYSLSDVKEALGPSFRFLKSESLGVISTPPSSVNFVRKYPWAHKLLKNAEVIVKGRFPFNRWGDHIIVTFKYTG